MNQLEGNIVNSFKLVKKDVSQLQKELAISVERQYQLMKELDEMRKKLSTPIVLKHNAPASSATVTVTPSKKTKKVFVASRTGSVVHEQSCPFAKNIKPKSKVMFASKNKAFNVGYKPCECLKRV